MSKVKVIINLLKEKWGIWYDFSGWVGIYLIMDLELLII